MSVERITDHLLIALDFDGTYGQKLFTESVERAAVTLSEEVGKRISELVSAHAAEVERLASESLDRRVDTALARAEGYRTQLETFRSNADVWREAIERFRDGVAQETADASLAWRIAPPASAP
jgi:hypothetical protein